MLEAAAVVLRGQDPYVQAQRCRLPDCSPSNPSDPTRSARHDREAQRIVSELCRGVPVCLTLNDGGADGDAWLLAAIETLGTDGLSDLAALSDGAGLLVTWHGAAARATAIAIPRTPQTLGEVARDGAAAVPQVAAPALRLLKAGRLLLQAVMAPLRDGAAPLLAARGILSTAADGFRGLIRTCPPDPAARARVPLDIAPDAEIVAFRVPGDATAHFAIVVGDPAASAVPPLVRVHSECFTGDLLGSLRCDCGPQLRGAIARMADEGTGVLLYLSQEGRGIGLVNKLRAYALQDTGLDTADANEALGYGVDERDFSLAACMLADLGVGRIRLLTNNPHKVAALREAGVDVVERVSLMYAANGTNDAYLAAKFGRLGHLG